jgi:hypothetical protein
MSQITCYVTQQLSSQYCTHTFSVLICKDRVRLIHLDCLGAIVTSSFSYVQEPWLAQFFRQYTHLSPEVRGIDTSVTTPANVNATHVQKARVALRLDDETPLYKFTIYGEDGGDVSYCFGSKPWFKGNGSPTGRGLYTPPGLPSGLAWIRMDSEHSVEPKFTCVLAPAVRTDPHGF